MKSKIIFGVILFLCIMMLFITPYASEPKIGGVLKAVIDADPPTLDPHVSTTTLVFVVGYHMFEGLYSLDESQHPIPMLATDFPEISDDNLVYTIKLRPGLKFHNGKDVNAEDAVASLQRWGNMSSFGKSVFRNVESIDAIDDLTIKMHLTQPTGVTLASLAMPNGGAFIYPKDICEKYPDKPVEEYIGTGPFKFVEWRPHQYIKTVRFEGYQPVDFPADGFGGKKVAYVDELQFIPISDEAVRLTSVEGGEYDFADFVPVDEYNRLKDHPTIQALPSVPRAWFAFQFNKRAGVMSDVKIREAFLTALEMGPILASGYGDEAFWRLDPSIMLKEQIWWSDVGKEKIYKGDIKMAKGKRKRSNKKEDTTKPNSESNPINQMEVQIFQQLINISNRYGKLKNQLKEYELVLANLKDKRKKIQKGEIDMPIMMPLGKKSFYSCTDKKQALKEMDSEIKVVANAVKGIKGQVESGADEYVSSAFRLQDFLEKKFKRFRPTNVYSAGCNPKKKEQILFEEELDKLAESEEAKEKMEKALKKAKEANEKMKKKSKGE